MKRINSIITNVCILIVVFSSCEKTIDYQIPEEELLIAVNGILVSDNTIKVNISKNTFILDTSSFKFIDNATVGLYENNVFVKNLTSEGKGNYSANDIIKTGVNYEILVKTEGRDDLKAVCILPPKMDFEIDTFYSGTTDWGSKKMDFIITIDDDNSVKNYYGISVRRKYINPWDSTTHEEDLRINSNDRIIEFYNDDDLHPFNFDPNMDEIVANSVFFSDEIVDGKKFSVRLSHENYYLAGTYYIKLYTISRDYYLYMSSYAHYNQSKGNPFSEPVQVYTNITGGVGIFSGYSMSQDSINIQRN